MKDKIQVLDLYCGLGGLSLGFEMTGAYATCGGIDNYDWAVKTFYHNHNHLNLDIISKPCDLSELDPKDVIKDIGHIPDIIVGGPPCQGFSHAGKRKKRIEDDERNDQVFHFLRFVKSIKPKVFLMENVSAIRTTGQKKKNELIEYLISEYEKIGYNVNWTVLNTVNYRVPQKRKRFIMIGSLNSNKPFSFPDPPCSDTENLFYESDSYLTVSDALSDLPTPIESEPQRYTTEPNSNLQRFLRKDSTKLHNHLVTKHGTEMLEKLNKQAVGTRLYPNWNHSWYRLDPKRPSPAVKENHRAPFVHFSEDRATSPRECARLQTIPDKYVLLGTKTAQLIMVGNAVPPIMAAHLGTQIAKQYFNIEVPIPWEIGKNPLFQEKIMA